MFRLFQIDPETGAIHINSGAIQRHKYGEALNAAIDAFRNNQLSALIRTLWRLPDSDERAHTVSFVSQLIHEVRHAVDLILTPYGFMRIRTGFEFYHNYPSLLHCKDNKIFPFAAGTNPARRKLLGVQDYEGSFPHELARISQNRRAVIEADNRRYKLDDGATLGFGGDAILEALAFGWQVEWLQNPRFDTDSLRALMPYGFPDRPEDQSHGKEMNQLDLFYRWHYPLIARFAEERTPAAGGLMYIILFASLCGSVVRDAKMREFDEADLVAQFSEPMRSRAVSERFPSNRFIQLLNWFGNLAKKGWEIPIDPLESWQLVCDASVQLWGMTPQEEIAADIAADERYLEVWQSQRSSDIRHITPSAAFSDLLSVRRTLFETLCNEPLRILQPLEISRLSDELLSVPLYFVYPQGAASPKPDTETVIEKLVQLPSELKAAYRLQNSLPAKEDPSEDLAFNVVYSSWEMKAASSIDAPTEGQLLAWGSVLASFSPAYKLSLYGFRYRTMLELDLVHADQQLQSTTTNVKWDGFFRDVEDVTSAWEYFHFYGLDSAVCNVCSETVSASEAVIASSATMRSSESFVANRKTVHGDMGYFQFDRDWSSWLVCRTCRAEHL